MANNASAIKRHKQSEVRRIRNKAVKASARTCAKKYTAAVTAKNAESAQTLLKELAHQQKLYNVTFSVK